MLKKIAVPKSALIIAAHPDDIEIQCGGTIAQWRLEHQTTFTYVLCTSGDKGAIGTSRPAPYIVAKTRESEQLDAANMLGVNNVIFLRYPDGWFENDRAIKLELATLIRFIKPEFVITHDPWHYLQTHTDHRTVGQAALDAVTISKEPGYYPTLSYVGLLPFSPACVLLFRSDFPDVYEDISNQIELKIKAVGAHQSQVSTWLSYKEDIILKAKNEGSIAGSKFAEVYKILDVTKL